MRPDEYECGAPKSVGGEPVYPNDTVCSECLSPRLTTTARTSDSTGWRLMFRCRDCGATGTVVNRRTGTSRYLGNVTTPRLADKRYRAAESGSGGRQ